MLLLWRGGVVLLKYFSPMLSSKLYSSLSANFCTENGTY